MMTEIINFMPKMELRQFLVLVIPGMIFSFTILYPIDKLSCYKLLPVDADFTSVNLPYVSLLIFYLLTSGLVFGVIFHFLYLWRVWRVFPRFIQKVRGLIDEGIIRVKQKKGVSRGRARERERKKAPIKNESTNKFLEYPGEFIEILLKTVNIDISYKQVYRTFFGSLSISTLLSFFVLLYFLKPLVLIPLFLLFIFSTFAAKKVTEEVKSANEDLVNKLPKFLEDVKGDFPEEFFKNMLKK